jgi:FkbM family methyltransferase
MQMKEMFYTTYLKKRYYRIIESLIKKILRFKNNSKNNTLKKTIQSAIYYTTDKNKILFTNNKDIKYLLSSRDWVSLNLFIDKGFDYKILTKAIKLLGKKNSKLTLINIGAHIGSTCIPAIKKNNFKNLIAFEPTKKIFNLLKANIFINEIDDRAQVYNLAISNKKTNLYLGTTKGNTGGNRILKNKQKNTEIVKSDILDNYTNNLNKNNSLIFIDAEGHEPNIFLGAKKTIKKKIPIVFDFYPSLLDISWIKNYDLLFKNYRFFYNLHGKNRKEKFNAIEIKKLYNHHLKNNNYTDILIK